jgi:hypothetical protein
MPVCAASSAAWPPPRWHTRSDHRGRHQRAGLHRQHDRLNSDGTIDWIAGNDSGDSVNENTEMPAGIGDFEYSFPDGTPVDLEGHAAPVGATTAAAVGYISAQQDIILGGGAVSLYQVRSDGNVWGASQSAGGSTFGSEQQLSGSGGFVGEPSVVQGSDGLIGLYARTSFGTV